MPKLRYSLTGALNFAAAAVLVIWLVSLVNFLLALNLHQYGIFPRALHGLDGIMFAPMLHGSWTHLIANTPPLFLLLVILFSNRDYRPASTLAVIWLAGGLGTWLIGRDDNNAVHIGASTVIFGLVAYLVLAGLLLKSWRTFFLAVAVFLGYGGIFLGVLPPMLNESQNLNVSWEGHLAGAIAGAGVAWRHRKK